MSFKQREAKRKAKRAPQIAASAARARRTEATAHRYFLCTVRYDNARCCACGGKLRKGAAMVYRKAGPVALCVPCADRDPLVAYRPSARWEASHGRARRVSTSKQPKSKQADRIPAPPNPRLGTLPSGLSPKHPVGG